MARSSKCQPWAAALLVLALAATAVASETGTHSKGLTLELSPEHSAFVHDGVPGALVHVPPGFDANGPLHVVVFLHGYTGCARVLMGAGPVVCHAGDVVRKGWDLASLHDAAGRNSLLVIPQLELLKRSGNPGCFGRAGCFRLFLDELLSGPLAENLGGARGLDAVASVTLVAHSAGFQAARAILDKGEVGGLVHHLVLMDALYGGAPAFARWLTTTRVDKPRLLSIYLGRGKTRSGSLALFRKARRKLGKARAIRARADTMLEALADHSLVVASGRGSHREVPHNYLAPVLAALPLPPR
ncbi:MAG: hypothetical protein OEZ06_06515 [Myxococcales bacterium]|nr:hypothetical protein [Myxococcales bacterium]